jgi:hypothetical protein
MVWYHRILRTLYANLALKGPQTQKIHADLIHDSFHEKLNQTRITPT